MSWLGYYKPDLFAFPNGLFLLLRASKKFVFSERISLLNLSSKSILRYLSPTFWPSFWPYPTPMVTVSQIGTWHPCTENYPSSFLLHGEGAKVASPLDWYVMSGSFSPTASPV